MQQISLLSLFCCLIAPAEQDAVVEEIKGDIILQSHIATTLPPFKASLRNLEPSKASLSLCVT